jgi:hypothetical protein
MPRVCDVADVPVGGTYQDYDEQKKQPRGPVQTVLRKGVQNGIGYNVIHEANGQEVRDMHFKQRERVWWINDGEGQ